MVQGKRTVSEADHLPRADALEARVCLVENSTSISSRHAQKGRLIALRLAAYLLHGNLKSRHFLTLLFQRDGKHQTKQRGQFLRNLPYPR